VDDDGRLRLHSQLTLFDDEVGRRSAFCAHCRRYYAKSEEPDPCIGRELPGVGGCCCGHGDVSKAYVDLVLSRHRLTGDAALAFFATHGCGPSR
jgi:hypothetical protein